LRLNQRKMPRPCRCLPLRRRLYFHLSPMKRTHHQLR
uniref:Uncharacterized protein n=1 Tax=Mesocestoides corti TaxID=53468 RepID=A0A0R3U6C1_MESCO